MNRSDVARRLSAFAGLDISSLPEEEVSHAVRMIDRLDPRSRCYEANLETLLSLEATIWAAQSLPQAEVDVAS